MPLPNPILSVVGCFAHPDDETVMAGGTLALLAARGVRTHVICATRGEGGETGEPPLVTDRALLGAVREAELRCALAALGVGGLTLLDYVDPDVGPDNTLSPFTADFDALVSRIAAALRAAEADVVLAHGPDGEYGHPAHRLIHAATAAAVARLQDRAVCFYSVAAAVPGIDDHLWNTSRMAHLALDITPWAAAKLAAMECHATQHALFKRRRQLRHVREALRRTESFYREWPVVEDGSPEDGFAALLRTAGAVVPQP